MRKYLIRSTAVLFALLTVLATSPTGAAADPVARGSADPAAPATAPTSAEAAFAGLPKLQVYGLIGKTKDGRTFSYTFSDPADAPAPDQTASAFCYWGAGLVSYNGRFNWTSTHTCSGAYGLVTSRGCCVAAEAACEPIHRGEPRARRRPPARSITRPSTAPAAEPTTTWAGPKSTPVA